MTNPEVEVKDRIFAALVYLLPLIYALPFGLLLLKQFPFLGIIYAPFAPLITIYYSLPFAGLIIFFALWFAVVRNQNISYFIRFNTMQVIMLDILLIVCNLIMNILSSGFGAQSLITETLNNTIFIGAVVIGFYGIIQSVRGFYAEIPALSEAVSSQIR
ncbi:Tic20 family protein [Myxosarcina sp. GI1(2024)]